MASNRESVIEKELRLGVEALGGGCRKWVSPGNDGVPDRIVTIKAPVLGVLTGRVILVETKTRDGSLAGVQVRQIGRLRREGAHVVVLPTIELVHEFLYALKEGLPCPTSY
jgi:hypothetical protein